MQEPGANPKTRFNSSSRDPPSRVDASLGPVIDSSCRIRARTTSELLGVRDQTLLLDKESTLLCKELEAVEDEVATLQREKIELLEQLVVLEGLASAPARSRVTAAHRE